MPINYIKILLYALLGAALDWSGVDVLSKPLNFFVIIILVVIIENTSRPHYD
jgi:hypothetical protein